MPQPARTDDEVPDHRQRIARNESNHRLVNEGIEEGRNQRDGLVPFTCECGRLGCSKLVELSLPEYEHVRADPRTFAIAPGHLTEIDELVRRDDRYWLVRKRDGPLGELADRTDPRRGGA